MSIGLALSGGGMKGIAHIGAIKAFEENHIYPSHIRAAVWALWLAHSTLQGIHPKKW